VILYLLQKFTRYYFVLWCFLTNYHRDDDNVFDSQNNIHSNSSSSVGKLLNFLFCCHILFFWQHNLCRYHIPCSYLTKRVYTLHTIEKIISIIMCLTIHPKKLLESFDCFKINNCRRKSFEATSFIDMILAHFIVVVIVIWMDMRSKL